ncbi:MAG TPA: hypothetical protein VJT31_24590 [Rugosimonospora sp.]|nr:hypothetical protein [Rugosimonospora sp.]
MNGTTAVGQYAAVRQLCVTGTAKYVREVSATSLREIAAEVERITGEPVSASTVLRWEQAKAKPTGPRALAYLAVIQDLMAVTRKRPCRVAAGGAA